VEGTLFEGAVEDSGRLVRIDAEHGLCAVKLAGWTPIDVIDHGAEEHARDLAG
jgi:hypothetical protein